MTVSVLGSGAFGTALAISLADNGPVTIWSRNPGQVDEIAKSRMNSTRLPGIRIPDAVTATGDLEIAARSRFVLLAVPMQQVRAMLMRYRDCLKDKTLVACCKGMELDSGDPPLSIIGQVMPGAETAILTGPSFANDIARGLPTALTLACAEPSLGKELQEALTTANLRLYRTTDVIGAQIGGALKNVIAIACGAVIGAGLGDSARAALMTRGYAEMQRMARAQGAQAETLAGLSGFGDLTLTCGSDQSRNFRLGLSIGRGEAFDSSITVEGAATARAVVKMAEQMQLDMPISQTVVHLLDGNVTIAEATSHLLARPLKEE